LAKSRARADASNPGRKTSRPRRRKAPTCDDCFFRRRTLCALDLEEPCPTFRPDTANGLVPPVQPALLSRDPAEAEIREPDRAAA
jgi:hypothetical protein